MSIWLPSPFHLLLLLAAADSRACHPWSLGSTALDKGCRTQPRTPHSLEAKTLQDIYV